MAAKVVLPFMLPKLQEPKAAPRTTMKSCAASKKATPGSQRLGGRSSYWGRRSPDEGIKLIPEGIGILVGGS